MKFMSEKQLKIFYQRKWNRGTFTGTFFSINPIRTQKEVSENYGENGYLPLGIIEIEASVYDSSENMFVPAVYHVENVSIIRGPNVQEIKEVVSYDRNYGDVAEDGEKIFCKGKLEKVINRKDRESYYRVTIGSLDAEGMDYLKVDI